jgi:hypothetical protein
MSQAATATLNAPARYPVTFWEEDGRLYTTQLIPYPIELAVYAAVRRGASSGAIPLTRHVRGSKVRIPELYFWTLDRLEER